MTGPTDTIKNLERRNEILFKKYDEVFIENQELHLELARGPEKLKGALHSALRLFNKKPDVNEKYPGEYRRSGARDAQFAVWEYLEGNMKLDGRAFEWWAPFEATAEALANADIGFYDPLTNPENYDRSERGRRSKKSIQEMREDAWLVWLVDIIITAADKKEIVELQGAPMDRAPDEDLEDEGVPDLLPSGDKENERWDSFRSDELGDRLGGDEMAAEDAGDAADAWLEDNEQPGKINRKNIDYAASKRREAEAQARLVKASGLTGEAGLRLVKRVKNLRTNSSRMTGFQEAQYEFLKADAESFIAHHVARTATDEEAHKMLMDKALTSFAASGIADRDA